jgi:hypothetical protein
MRAHEQAGLDLIPEILEPAAADAVELAAVLDVDPLHHRSCRHAIHPTFGAADHLTP